jgi:hypothetical protein
LAQDWRLNRDFDIFGEGWLLLPKRIVRNFFVIFQQAFEVANDSIFCHFSSFVQSGGQYDLKATIGDSSVDDPITVLGQVYFDSRIKVGATPDSVENPDGPTAVSQLEQPCTLPK